MKREELISMIREFHDRLQSSGADLETALTVATSLLVSICNNNNIGRERLVEGLNKAFDEVERPRYSN